MNIKRGLLIGALGFFLVLSFLVVKLDKSTVISTDPVALPAPSSEFDDWRKQWEKQR